MKLCLCTGCVSVQMTSDWVWKVCGSCIYVSVCFSASMRTRAARSTGRVCGTSTWWSCVRQPSTRRGRCGPTTFWYIIWDESLYPSLNCHSSVRWDPNWPSSRHTLITLHLQSAEGHAQRSVCSSKVSSAVQCSSVISAALWSALFLLSSVWLHTSLTALHVF